MYGNSTLLVADPLMQVGVDDKPFYYVIFIYPTIYPTVVRRRRYSLLLSVYCNQIMNRMTKYHISRVVLAMVVVL